MPHGRPRAGVPVRPLAVAVLASLLCIGCTSSTSAPSAGSVEGDATASPGGSASIGASIGASIAPSPSTIPSSSASMEPADPGQVAAAAAVIVAADPADPDSIGSLQGIRFTAAGTEAAREALESGVTGDALWAATWVYATAGDDPAPLLPQVTSDSDSVRALAAAGLASLGVVDGLAALASSVDSTSALEGSEPPLSVGTYAAGALRMLTGADPGPAGWTAWLDAHRSLLVYDPEARTWSAP